MNKIGFLGGVKGATAIKKMVVCNARATLPLLPTQLSHMFVTLALVMGVARAFHTTITFITVATLSPPIIPIMFNQTET